MSELSALIKKRGTIKSTVTNIKKFADKCLAELDAGQASNKEQIETRLEKLNEVWAEFHDVDNQIVLNAGQMSESDEFQDRYFDTKASLKRLLNIRSPSIAVNQLDNTQSRTMFEGFGDRSTYHASDIRLPRVIIEPFTGDYAKWQSFQDQFTNTVHNVETLSNVHKFQYLKGLLKGDAASLIRHMPITDANYNEAWEKLVKRYDKKKNTVKELIDVFINQPAAVSGTIKPLRQICDISDEILRGLKALGSSWESRDPWLIYILFKKLDADTQQAWAQHSNNIDFPTVDDLLKFLTDRCDALEACAGPRKTFSNRPPATTKVHSTFTKASSCAMCSNNHPLFRCFRFKRLGAQARKQFVIQNNLCHLCLKPDHDLSSCTMDLKCFFCKEKHHTLVHIKDGTSTNDQQPTTSNHYAADTHTTVALGLCNLTVDESNPTCNHKSDLVSENKQSSVSGSVSFSRNKKYIYQSDIKNAKFNCSSPSRSVTDINPSHTLLSTLLLHVSDSTGKIHTARALLDSGSQSTLISETCVQRIRLLRKQACVSVDGLAAKKAGVTKGLVELEITSIHDKNTLLKIKALILPKLTSLLPSRKIDDSKWSKVRELELADPTYNTPGEIDLILGADVFFDIILPDQIKTKDHPCAQLTIFGWILGGRFHSKNDMDRQPMKTFHTVTSNFEDELKALQKFWELEEVYSPPQYTDSEQLAENHYIQNLSRGKDGKYIVKLPFKDSPQLLGSSIHAAKVRLFAMERRFKKNIELKNQYCKFMEEYENLGHMEKVPNSEVDSSDHYYLPHHAVLKDVSTTTKLRAVFDGSCVTASGISLNDILLVGPTIQQNLMTIILRFRLHKIAITADVEKMYRQVTVHNEDRNFQRIVWRNNSSDEITHYKLSTVTYGTSSAPFLAIRTLHQIAKDYEKDFQLAATIATKDFYVDDMLTGCDNILQAKDIVQQMSSMLSKGGFKLRKWMSNSHDLIKIIPEADREIEPLKLDDCATVKTLGLHWNPAKDYFSFKVASIPDQKATKRTLISEAAKIFDPLGWLAPITVSVKILFQSLWLQKLDWDDELPERIKKQWIEMKSCLSDIEKILIPRLLFPSSENKRNIQLHIFSDASESAYGAVAYIRCEDDQGIITTHMITAKTKVAPIKQVSLPRLELCGAVLLCRLAKFIILSMDIHFNDIYAWTDSAIVLHWLSDHPRRWKCFIGNRTSEILDFLPRQHWRHITSKENPADLASRGLSPLLLADSSMWWNGPTFLNKSEKCWPSAKVNDEVKNINISDLEERPNFIKTFHTNIKMNIISNLFEKISKFSKIKRIISYIFRFISNLSSRKNLSKMSSKDVKIPPVSVDELKFAENLCFVWAQSQAFSQEINDVKKNKDVSKGSPLKSLTPFLDENNILRVGGRIEESKCPFDTKHPIILPKNHVLSQYIINEYHTRYLHPGSSLLTSILRQRFWVLNCRNMVRFQTSKCISCFKQKKLSNQQLMGNLPEARVSSGRPFLYTGVDYAGPIYLKEKTARGRCKITKGYIALFVCMSVKAIHLEVVSDMTTTSFIAALQRFVSRRGVPVEIYSDNGSNFVGCRRELHELFELFKTEVHLNSISQFLSFQNIVFKFNPASAPHFGGLWEANVKSVKQQLRRVTGTTHLTFEELTTLLNQIEAVLNSRPLCAVSEDASTYDALTPAHFLIGEPLTSIPEPNLDHIKTSRLSKWQNIQTRVQGFWKIWSRDYITSLNQRQKWQERKKNLEENQLVIIQEDNVPKLCWPLGRIKQLHEGKDGLVRVATIKTAKGEINRPIVKLTVLPNY